MANVLPVARSLFLCRNADVGERGTNVEGVFSVLYFESFPAVYKQFVAFFHLTGGVGEVSIHLDVRRADDGRLVHTTDRTGIYFPDRGRVIQVMAGIRRVPFDRPGVYLVDLYCDNVWVADTTLELREDGT